MEAVKLNREIVEDLGEFCVGCEVDHLSVIGKWVFDDNGHIQGKKTVLTCDNLEFCTRMYEYLKERQNG